MGAVSHRGGSVFANDRTTAFAPPERASNRRFLCDNERNRAMRRKSVRHLLKYVVVWVVIGMTAIDSAMACRLFGHWRSYGGSSWGGSYGGGYYASAPVSCGSGSYCGSSDYVVIDSYGSCCGAPVSCSGCWSGGVVVSDTCVSGCTVT